MRREEALVTSPSAEDRLIGVEEIEESGGIFDAYLLLPLLKDDAPFLFQHGARTMIGEVRFRVLEALQRLYRRAKCRPNFGPVKVRRAMAAAEVQEQAATALAALPEERRGEVLRAAQGYLDRCVMPRKQQADALRAYRVLAELGLIEYREEEVEPVSYRTPLQREVIQSQMARPRPRPHLRVRSPSEPHLTLGYLYRNAIDGRWMLDFAEGDEGDEAQQRLCEGLRRLGPLADGPDLPERLTAALGSLASTLKDRYPVDLVPPADR